MLQQNRTETVCLLLGQVDCSSPLPFDSIEGCEHLALFKVLAFVHSGYLMIGVHSVGVKSGPINVLPPTTHVSISLPPGL